MAVYKFWGDGEIAGRETRIEFEFEDDRLLNATYDGIKMSADKAERLLRLDMEFGPGYVEHGKPGSRLNALNFLRWEAFDREPIIGGDPGIFPEIDEAETPEGVVY